MDEAFGDIESVKTVSDVISPVSGTVAEVNEDLLTEPKAINDDPYEAWLIRVENATGMEELLTAEEYIASTESEK